MHIVFSLKMGDGRTRRLAVCRHYLALGSNGAFLIGAAQNHCTPVGKQLLYPPPLNCSRVHVATLGIEAAVLIIDMQ
jgi:hypothetical protein